MLKQYKRFLYILGILVFTLVHLTVYSQGTQPSKKAVSLDICKEIAMPVDLFQVLGIQISASNGYWIDNNGKVVNNIFDPTLSNEGSYTFNFIVTTEYCGTISGDRFEVTINLRETFLTVKTNLEDPKCSNDNGSITIESIDAGSGEYQYMLEREVGGNKQIVIAWTDTKKGESPAIKDLGEGEYYLHVVDKDAAKQCVREYIETITLKMTGSQIKVTVATTDVVIPGMPVTLEPKIEGGQAPYTYAWYAYDKQAGDFETQEFSNQEKVQVTSNNGDQYKLVVTDAYGCSNDGQYRFDIHNITPKLLGNYYFCQGSFIEMYTNILMEPRTAEELFFATSEEPDLSKWQGFTVKVYESATANVELDKSWFVSTVNSGAGGTVTKYVDVINPEGIIVVSRKEVTLTVFSKPYMDLRIVADKIDWDIEDKVKFETTPAGMKWYNYYMNGKLIGTETSTNIYDVDAVRFTGTVQDLMKVVVGESVDIPNSNPDNTCAWEVSKAIMINIPLPNTFTPDGDGINDVFLGGDKFKGREFHLEIINRQGHRLYFGDKGWDGTYKGTPVAPGTYYYVVNMKMADGTTKTIKGAVTLIRQER